MESLYEIHSKIDDAIHDESTYCDTIGELIDLTQEQINDLCSIFEADDVNDFLNTEYIVVLHDADPDDERVSYCKQYAIELMGHWMNKIDEYLYEND